MKRRRSFLHILSSIIFAAALAAAVDVFAALFSAHISFAVFAGIFLASAVLLIVFNISTKWLWLFFWVLIAAAAILLTAIQWGYERNIRNTVLPEPGSGSVSIVDMKGNVVNNHFIDERGSEQFQIRTRGFDAEFMVSIDNPLCFVKYENDTITLKCPKEESCILTVRSTDGQHFAHALISNPGRFMRETGPYFSELIQQFREINLQQSNTYKLLIGTAK